MMEVERIKALEQYEVRENQRVDERRRGAAVLTEQIEERKRERVRTEELRDTERISMLKEIERMKEQELQVAIEKKLAAKVRGCTLSDDDGGCYVTVVCDARAGGVFDLAQLKAPKHYKRLLATEGRRQASCGDQLHAWG
jgi:hypothetical protein